MRIVLYGNFVVPYCSEVQYANTLEAMGNEVIRLQETTATTETVLNESLKSSLLIWVHSHGFINKGTLTMRQVLAMLKEANITTMAYHLDLYYGLDRWKEYENSDYFNIQHFFTVDKLMADWFNENTEVVGHYLQAGVYEPECYMAEPVKNPPYDIAFVGSRFYHKEWQYRPQLVDWLQANYGQRFAHYGGDGLGVVRGDSLNRLYADTKVVVGDTLCLNFDYPYYWSDRVYETIGRGGFIIHPYIKGMEEHFENRKHLVFYNYGDFADLKLKIDYYLEHPEEREAIRLAGHEHVKKNHTYTNRWQTIIKELGL